MLSQAELDLSQGIIDVIEKFPTSSADFLSPNTYFRYVNHFLKESKKFLEIGYRKGVFVEVCKWHGIESVHVDITDELLRAKPTEDNRCVTSSSLKFLRTTTEQFDLIFQDGAKDYRTRKVEYELILTHYILTPSGTIVVDDLHYPDCGKAFQEVQDRFAFHTSIKVHGKKRTIGVLQHIQGEGK